MNRRERLEHVYQRESWDGKIYSTGLFRQSTGRIRPEEAGRGNLTPRWIC